MHDIVVPCCYFSHVNIYFLFYKPGVTCWLTINNIMLLDTGISREFRIVRDNRENQNANKDPKPEVPHRSVLGNERAGTSFREKRFDCFLFSHNKLILFCVYCLWCLFGSIQLDLNEITSDYCSRRLYSSFNMQLLWLMLRQYNIVGFLVFFHSSLSRLQNIVNYQVVKSVTSF